MILGSLLLLYVAAFGTDCPPCFDCHLSVNPCFQFAGCSDASGKCICPAGFTSNDCSLAVCGSLPSNSRPLKNNRQCSCDDGWTGSNCNVCLENAVCDAMIPTKQNGTCHNSLIPIVGENHVFCNVTNKGILERIGQEKPQVTLSCSRESASCKFQFWKSEKESFYCALDKCDFSKSVEYGDSMNKSKITCGLMKCMCYPNGFLCGEPGGIDLTEYFPSEDGPKGPVFIDCDQRYTNGEMTRACTLKEENLKSVLGLLNEEYIKMDCPIAGECMHYTQVPEYTPPIPPTFSLAAVITMAFCGLGVVGSILGGMFWYSKKSEAHSNSGYVSIPENNSDARQSSMMQNHVPRTIAFRNLSYFIDSKKTKSSRTGNFPILSQATQTCILENVQGLVKPGQVMAIMGGSGAGKTTLLDILARKNKSGIVSGDILVNGSNIDYEAYRNIIGYVDQEDTLLETLTVYETILCSALLRLPESVSFADKEQRVQEIMEELNIMSVANRRIGSSFSRGLSGGEKRRVSIACELVTSPSILFLDEPTSGLDTFNAYNVIECLVALARDFKRTIIFTIHQPRSNIYALFDQLVLLSKGKLVYSGPAQQPVIDHFANLGYVCPVGFNIADYLVDLTMHANKKDEFPDTDNYANRDVEEGDDIMEQSMISTHSGLSKRRIREEQESMLYSPTISPETGIPGADLNAASDELLEASIAPSPSILVTPELRRLIDGYFLSQIGKSIKDEIHNSALIPSNNDNMSGRLQNSLNVPNLLNYFAAPKVSWWTQFTILSGRTFRNLVRNPDLLLTHYVISIVVAVICGSLFQNLDYTLAGFQNRLGLMFFVCALFGFGCLSSMQVFASERLVFLRERANRYYSPITYFASKILFDMIPLRVVPPFILGTIMYPMVNLRAEPEVVGKFLLVLILFNFTAASACFAISIIFSQLGVANLIATLVMLFEMLFGGLLLNQETIPKAFAWMNTLSFFHYAFESLVVNEVAGLTLVEKKYGLQIDVPGSLILKTFGLDVFGYWKNIYALLSMTGIFLLVGFAWLQLVVRERR